MFKCLTSTNHIKLFGYTFMIHDLAPWDLRSFFAVNAAKIDPLLIVEVSWLDKCSWLECEFDMI